MTTAIQLKNITIHPVVEQQGPFFDALVGASSSEAGTDFWY
jgi:hypothetical protein